MGQEPVVLVVEDDQGLRGLLLSAIGEEFPGARVVAAVDGEEALQIARELLPRVVLLDRMLPVLSGDAVVQGLRAEAGLATSAVIGVSAGDDRDGPLLELCDVFLRKPFELDEILDLIGRHLDPYLA